MSTPADQLTNLGDSFNNVLQQKADKELLSDLDSKFNKARINRIQFEQQWFLNLAFYFGKHYVTWAPGALGQWTKLWEPPAPSWRVRLISNRVRPLIRTELAKVTKENPTGFVIPSSSDDEDLAAAQAGDSIWEHFYRTKNIRRVLRRAEFWTLICGTGFIKEYWDKNAKDLDGVDGDIQVEPISPFHLLVPNTQEEEIENQPYIIHYTTKSPDWVETTFNKKVAPDVTTSSGLLEQKFFNALGLRNQPTKDQVLVKEIWIKPCKKFLKGTLVIWAGSTILQAPTEEWPYKHNEYPFIKLEHIQTGRFYADSTIVDLIPLQKEYNRTRSQIIEAKNRMAKPQLLAYKGSIDANKVTSEPGLIIFVTPGFELPQPIPLAQLPTYVIEELDRNLRDMDDISGQHEITKGRTPPGVTAATAISYLQEEDDTKLSQTINSLEEGVEKLGRHVLSHVQQFWTIKRTVRVTGSDDELEAFEFSNQDIRNNTDFYIETGSAAPRSKSAKQAFITELGKMGWISPDRALKYLDMAETGRLYQEMAVDSKQAQRENIKMAVDLTVPVNDWDNHATHIETHNNFRKRQKFEGLSDNTKMIFQQHVITHQTILQQTQMQSILNSTQPGQAQPGQPNNGQQQQIPAGG